MESLIERLYPLPDFRRTPLTLLRWWESRRLLYNRVVGMTGVVTLAGVFVLHPDRADVFGPEIGLVVLLYGVLANLCYTFGWLTELLASALWGRNAPDMGPLLFRQGLIFSVGLTLMPLLITTFFVLAQAVFGLLT